MIMLRPRRTKGFWRKIPKSRLLFFIFVIFVVLFGYTKPDFFISPLTNVSYSLSKFKDFLNLRTHDIFSFFENKNSLAKENVFLKKINREMKIKLDLLSRKSEFEKKTLQSALLRRTEKDNYEPVTAFILAKPPLASYGTLIVDLGAKDGISPGSLVLSSGFIIGKIDIVREQFSTVSLFGRNGENYDLIVREGRNNVEGTGAGMGVIKAKMSDFNNDAEVFSVSFRESPDFLFGFSTQIFNQNDSGEKTVVFLSPVNFFELESVEIISNAKKN